MSRINEDYISRIFQERRGAASHRLYQAQRVRDILTNNMDVTFRDVVKPGEEPVVGNLIWAAARTISQRVGRMPRLDVKAEDSETEAAQAKAEKHERRLTDYTLRMNLAATRLQAAYWLVVHDMAPLVVTPNPDYKIPVIEVRDPMTCFPGTVWPHKPEIVDVLFANRMTPWAAQALYPDKLGGIVNSFDDSVESVTMGEYFTNQGVTICLLEPQVKVIDYIPNPCPGQSLVVMTRGFSPDMDFHGQFDHVVSALVAQAKLFALVMAYANQQVAAETVVVGEIASNHGQWATGPGAVNQITPMPGAQAQKLTNNMSVQVFNELDRLERAIRLGGQFPAQLSGEPVASIATGRGLEQLTVTVDDNVAYWQTVLDDAFMRAYGLVPPLAREMMSPGFEDFSPEDTTTYVRSLSGADPAETVRMLQLQGAKNLSRVSIMDRLPEVDSPLKELERIDIDDMRTTLIRSLDQQILTEQINADTVAQMIRRRKTGEEIEDIWVEIKKMEAEQQAAAQQQVAGVQGGQPQGPQAQSLQDILSPQRLAGAAQEMGIRAARMGPETTQGRQALMSGLTPTPGGQTPGPVGIPA